MTKDDLKELRWLRGLVAEREGHGGDIPVWLALEWIDDAIRRASDEPSRDWSDDETRDCPRCYPPVNRGEGQ